MRLVGKHTIFGKITGNTIYNAIALGNLETGEHDRPLDPAPKILSTEITVNPFKDIKIAKPVPKEASKEAPKEPKKGAKISLNKGIKNKNLVSFDDDEEEVVFKSSRKVKSSHEVLNDPKLSKKNVIDPEKLKQERAKREKMEKRKEEFKKKREAKKDSKDDDDDDILLIFKNKRKRLEKLKNNDPTKKKKTKEHNSSSSSSGSDSESASDSKNSQGKSNSNALHFRKDKIGSNLNSKAGDNSNLTPLELQRIKYLKNKKIAKNREESTLAKLAKFTNKLKSQDTKEDPENWMNHKLKCSIDSARAYDTTNKNK